MSRLLSDVAEYVTDKVKCSELDEMTFVGMDNLIPNRGGVTISEYVPKDGSITAYRKGDILIGNIRPYFKKIWLAENDGGCSPDVLCIRSKGKINPLFLYAALAQDLFFDYDVKGAKGSKMPRGDKNHIMSFPIPELDNEEEIGKLINNIYQMIQNNNAMCATIEKTTKQLFDYWFMQFDFPDDNGKPYKSSGGEMVYNETLKREIPKGWKACNILDVADWVGGAQPPKSTFIYEPRNGYVRFIQNRDYADDNYKTWIPESKSNKICDRIDIMMDKYGDAGRIRFGLAGAYNVALAKIAIEKENLREYIRGFLSSEAIYQYLYNACMASTRASLNEEILGNLNLSMPSEEILNQYQTIAEQNIQLILTLSDENKQLASLRDWLLPMLMNGQIKVSD